MSDSGKLRLVYGLIYFAWSLLNVAGIITFSFLLGFRILPSNFEALIIIFSFLLLISIVGTVNSFINIYNIGKLEKTNH